MKNLFVIFGIIVVFFIVSLGKCEILTLIHGDEFTDLYKENTMLGEQKYLKILEYSKDHAKVYYVGEGNSMGNVLSFVKSGEQWKSISWDCIWSISGSASETIWPYWWHFIYGGF